MYFLLGISLSLAFLLGINLLVAILAAAVWRVAGRSIAALPARVRGQIIFGLRILPVAAAVVFVSLFVVPAYVLYEPAASGEVVGPKLAVIAAASSLAVAFAFFRVVRTWLATRRLIAEWLTTSERIDVPNVSIPVYRFDHRFPVVAVIGILRPRLFVTGKVLEALTEPEFCSAVAHEFGHLRAMDNLKRSVLRACRDMLVVPFGKRLDREWSDSVEMAADEFAARSANGASALDLASALVKIARMVPKNAGRPMPQASFLIDGHTGDVTARVRHLIDLDREPMKAISLRPLGLSPAFWIWSGIFAVLMLLPLAEPRVLSSIQVTTEHLVTVLQ